MEYKEITHDYGKHGLTKQIDVYNNENIVTIINTWYFNKAHSQIFE